MKNKKLFIPAFVLLIVGMAACKPNPVDVFGTNKEIAQATMIGTDSVRSGGIVSGLNFRVVEYKFLPDNKALRTEITVGDGVYLPADTMHLSYVMEYAENYVGMNVTFTPEKDEQAPFIVYFNENMLIENGDTLREQVAKVAYLTTVMDVLPGTTWWYKDSTLWIDTTKVDTIIMNVVPSRQKDPVTGKVVIVRDTTYDTIKYESYDTIGTMMYTNIEFTINRDSNNLVNTGHYFYEYSLYAKDSTKIDSVSILKDYDAHWGLNSVTTARRFGVTMLSADKKQQDKLAISLYNLSAGTLKVDGTKEFKLKK